MMTGAGMAVMVVWGGSGDGCFLSGLVSECVRYGVLGEDSGDKASEVAG